jgi:hypothetical protein
MEIFTASGPADRRTPNEDWFSAEPGLIVVLDGATARTDTGCSHGTAWYARHLGAALLEADLATAIREVAGQHPECDLTHPATPAAAVAVLRSVGESLEYLVLGDVTVVLDGVDGLRTVVDDRVAATAVEQRREVDRFAIGSSGKQSALIRMKHAELAVRNRPGGYWVAAADPDVAQEARTGEVPLNRLRRFAVLTDGAARLVEPFGLVDWAGLLDLLGDAGPEEAIRRLRATEAADPEGRRWPRNKRSDDATIVFALTHLR